MEPNQPPLQKSIASLAGRLQAWTARWRVPALLLSLLRVPYTYLKEIQWENDQAYGFAFTRGLWNAGWIGRSGLLALGAGLLASAAFLGSRQAGLSQPVLVIGLALYALGWALALVVSTRLPLWGFLLLCAYLDWFTLLVGGGLAGTPGFALPSLWMLLLGGWLARSQSGRSCWAVLAVLGLGAGQLTFAALGLGRLVPESAHAAGRLALGGLYLLLLAIGLRLPFPRARPSPGLVFGGTLALAGLYFGLALAHDPDELERSLLLASQSLLGFVDLFWFWLGWTLLEGVLTVGAWSVRETTRVFAWSWFPRLLPVSWALAAFAGWWLTGEPPVRMMVWSHQLGLDAWVNSWSLPVWFTIHDLVLPTVGFLAGSLLVQPRPGALAKLASRARAGARRLGRLPLLRVLSRSAAPIRYVEPPLRFLSPAVLRGLQPVAPPPSASDRIARLHGVWVALILGLLAFYQSLEAFATLAEDAALGQGAWAALLLVGGIVWELARSGAAYWESETDTRQYALAAGLLFLLVISTVTLGAGLPDLVKEYTLYSFLGVVYLGLPLSLYTLLPEWVDYEPVSGWNLLGLVGIGIVSAVLVLGIDPRPGWQVGLAPLVWGIALLAFGRRLGRFEHPLDGIIAGAALGLGFVTFWMSPEMLVVPFAAPINEWQLRYLLVELNRPILLPGQAWFSLAGIGLGGLSGWVYARRVGFIWKLLASLAGGLAFGAAAAWLVAR